MQDDMEYAINVAKQHMTVVQPAVVKPEHWCAYVIVRRRDGGHSVYRADAWTPKVGGILPWSKPEGEPIARVELDLSVTLI